MITILRVPIEVAGEKQLQLLPRMRLPASPRDRAHRMVNRQRRKPLQRHASGRPGLDARDRPPVQECSRQSVQRSQRHSRQGVCRRFRTQVARQFLVQVSAEVIRRRERTAGHVQREEADSVHGLHTTRHRTSPSLEQSRQEEGR